jgi:hypothetical protein
VGEDGCPVEESDLRWNYRSNYTMSIPVFSLLQHRSQQKGYDEIDIYVLWEKILLRYSRCKLTYNDDKLPALSGIATVYGKITGDRYVAGLWERSCPLVWCGVVNLKLSSRCQEHRPGPGPLWMIWFVLQMV